MKKSRAARVSGTLAVLGLLLTACGGQDPDVHQGTATLTPAGGSAVSGEASIRWNPDTGILAVTVELDGLEAGGTYSSQITSGCERGTGHVYKLDNVVGGPGGAGTATTEIADVERIELDGTWAVKVGRPPGGGPQACGVVGTP